MKVQNSFYRMDQVPGQTQGRKALRVLNLKKSKDYLHLRKLQRQKSLEAETTLWENISVFSQSSSAGHCHSRQATGIRGHPFFPLWLSLKPEK